MGDIKQWSDAAESGYQSSTAAPDGAPENHNASAVNNIIREVMAAVRRQWEQKEWFDFGETPTYLTTTSFQVPDTYSAEYAVGRRVRATVSAVYKFGTINSVVAGAGTVDVTLLMDTGEELAAGLTAVELGISTLASPGGSFFALGDQILMPIGSAGAPPYSFEGSADTGFFLEAGVLKSSVDGAEVFALGLTHNESLLNLKFPAGLVTDAGLQVSGDADTGLYEVSAGTLGVAAGGTLAGAFDTAGFYSTDGTVGAPSWSFPSQRNTGVYRAGANTVGIAANGIAAMTFGSTRLAPQLPLEAEEGTAAAPTYTFELHPDSGTYYDATLDGVAVAMDGETVAAFRSNEPGSLRLYNIGVNESRLVVGAGSATQTCLFSARKGDGTSSDPNGFYLVGRNSLGTDWEYNKALRWSTAVEKWTIGAAGWGTGEDEVMTKSAVEALIAAHVSAYH